MLDGCILYTSNFCSDIYPTNVIVAMASVAIHSNEPIIKNEKNEFYYIYFEQIIIIKYAK